MRLPWLGVREPAVADGFGGLRDAQQPVPVKADPSRLSRQPAATRPLWAVGARLVRNAIIGAAAMALVPIATVVVRGDRVASRMYYMNGNTAARVAMVQPVRAFAVAPDPSITPMQAGIALNALQYRRSPSAEFEAIVPAARPVRPWRTTPLSPDMFLSSRPDVWDGPSSRGILEESTRGFSPRELAWLRALADAPLWRGFDVVAHAPAVDMVGAQLTLPFDPNALPQQRPLPSFRDSKELAYAAVSRAAYLRAVGRPQDAEAVLRSIVSFGFTFVDNGTTTLDELIGTVIVGIGRDALQRFYVLEHDPRAGASALAAPERVRLNRARGTLAPDEVRRLLLARLADPAAPRPERFETVRALSLMSCTNVRGVLFGPSDEVSDAIARARNTLARYPSERALIDLAARLPSMVRISTATGPLQSVLVSPATVAGVVLRNPRMAACTLLLTSGQ